MHKYYYVKMRLMVSASIKYGAIFCPCASPSLQESFTIRPDGEIWFWFNDSKDSTHLLREMIK